MCYQKTGCTGAAENPDLLLLGTEIGKIIGMMHASNIIHGDLTTSNILVHSASQLTAENKLNISLIDFGLSHVDTSTEDKGVDLYVLERAITSTHSSIPWFFDVILKSYQDSNTHDGDKTMEKFEEVRLRGRKRTMVG